MKILRVSHWLYPDEIGGGEYHVHAMSRDQAAMGHDVTVLKVTDDVETVKREWRDGYEIVYCPATFNVLKNDISIPVAKKIFGSSDFDVIHAHSHFYFSTNLAALNRCFSDTPLAITNHSLYSQSAPERVFDLYLRTIGKWTYNQADIAFCYTDAEKDALRELGVKSRIEVIPNGIDTERFTPDGQGMESIDANGPVVLFVGRFVDGKRPELVIDAFGDVLTEYPDAELYLCGDGPLHESTKHQTRDLGINESVTFIGEVSYEKMPTVYRSSDILVLPSRAEGVPRAVLEAMASGVPVVTSDLEQISKIVGKGGRVIQTDSADALSATISKVLAADKASVSAREQVVENHQWQSTVTHTTKLLESLCHCK
ncbi:glycosyltransferase family 4 protein [Halopenitus salinus]|uniref:Glycosyltransferase family 4 protein n=1 Tax=Halopenitus salinus TaxID=1198295 RepID=A0ABD5UZ70_9EURY